MVTVIGELVGVVASILSMLATWLGVRWQLRHQVRDHCRVVILHRPPAKCDCQRG
jgi:hypothetical protein